MIRSLLAEFGIEIRRGIEQALINARSSLTLKVIRFEPWLVGKREALLADLFRGLRAKIEDFRSDPLLEGKLTNADGDLIDRLGTSIERYQVLLEGAEKGVAAVTKVDPSLHTGVAAAALGVLNWIASKIVAKSKAKIQTIEDLRLTIKGDLRTLAKLSANTRFIVVVDDVDRLEPQESMEMLRLIRAVADFPLVTYFVCYDREYLAAQVKEIVKVGDGHEYLKKIFQSVIGLPPQDAFALRRFARKLLGQRFPEQFSYETSGTDRGRAEREAFFFDHWCGKLVTTPRAAVRLAEAVTLGWPGLKTHADFIDYTWLQLIKLECHDLYEWVRDYVVNIGAFRDDGRPGDEEPRQFAEALRNILSKYGWGLERDQAGMRYFLPGLENYIDKDKPRVLRIDRDDLGKFEAEKRLGSPSHWRLYFAFDRPSYALDDDTMSAFRSAAGKRDVAAGVAIVQELLKRPHPRNGYFFSVFLERLFDSRETLTADEQIGLARILADVMDDVPPSTGLMLDTLDAWRRAESLMLPAAAAEATTMCSDGRAINWLADLLRTQGFAHGRPESSSSRIDPWLDYGQFEAALEALLARVYALPFAGVLDLPKVISMMFFWLQLGDTKKLETLVAQHTATNVGLLDFLEAMRTWVDSSSRGRYKSLQSMNLRHFLDVETTGERVRSIAADTSDVDLSKHATELLDVWDWHLDR
jgi:hypothetical protein